MTKLSSSLDLDDVLRFTAAGGATWAALAVAAPSPECLNLGETLTLPGVVATAAGIGVTVYTLYRAVPYPLVHKLARMARAKRHRAVVGALGVATVGRARPSWVGMQAWRGGSRSQR